MGLRKTSELELSVAFAVVLILLVGSTALGADNPCADGGMLLPALERDADGIGGTGARDETAPDLAAAEPSESGIGGTGYGPDGEDTGGIGGTGHSPGDPDDEGGIGGTGVEITGDTGIVGVVNGFGSICVGGREVHYDAATPVTMDGMPSESSVLAVGSVVEVVAAGRGEELTALSIGVTNEVAGVVSAVDAARGEFTVAGQRVAITSSTWADFDDGPGRLDAAGIEVGDTVRVAGLRSPDGSISATQVQRIDGAVETFLSGPVQLRNGRSFIGDAEVVFAGGAPEVDGGRRVRVRGVWNDGRLLAERAEALPEVPFSGRVAEVAIEGFVSPRSGGSGMRVGAFDLAVDDPNALPAAGTRVRVRASARRGRYVADRIAPMRPLHPRDPALDPDRPVRPKAVPAEPAAAPAKPSSASQRSVPRQGSGAAPRVRQPGAQRAVVPKRPQRVERPNRPQRPQRPPRPERPVQPVRPRRPPRPDR